MLHGETERKADNDAELAITVLSQLFPYFGEKIGMVYEVYDWNIFRRNCQIAHPEKFDRYFNLELNNIGLKKSEIIKAVHSLNCKDFRTYLLKQDKRGISYEFLEEVKAMIPEIIQDRAKVIIVALLNTFPELDVISNKNILSMRASTYADHRIIDLLEVVTQSERFCLLTEIIHDAKLSSLQSMANVINMIELGYGRLGAKGEEIGYKKVLTLEELIQLEDIFTQKIKSLLKEYSLLDVKDWRMIGYLLECFDFSFAKEYFLNNLKDNKNILLFLDRSVETWTGGGTKYEINEEYKKYLTVDQVLRAIESQKSQEIYLYCPIIYRISVWHFIYLHLKN